MLAHIFKECLYIYLFECVHIYICICMCVCVCMYNDVKNISDDIGKKTIIGSDQRFKR